MTCELQASIVIVGSGLAGMVAALELAPLPVVLVTQGQLGKQTSSMLAQGGIASACLEQDQYEAHIQDTLGAGAGLNDPVIVRDIISMGKDAIDLLQKYDVVFDCDENNQPKLGLEAAHTHHRIFHIHGDATGKHIIDQLSQAVLNSAHITLMEETTAQQLLKNDNGSIIGVVLDKQGRSTLLRTSRVILATGGIGGLYGDTTNPIANYGHGLALAANIGAVLADLEFIQFHPTALDHPSFPKVLISEAVRGEGALLFNEKNERFLNHMEGKELAPRDVIARAIFQEIHRGGKVFLDARGICAGRFSTRFPTIYFLCKQVGIDPQYDLIPVKPVEHFHMGGIATDVFGKSSITGLWAIGECASTGLHGANRLASNSLLEATVMAMRAVKSIIETPLELQQVPLDYQEISITSDTSIVQDRMQSCLGIMRNENNLIQAIRFFYSFIEQSTSIHYPVQIAFMIAVSAILRQESRGAHAREDFPNSSQNLQRSFMTYTQALQAARQFL